MAFDAGDLLSGLFGGAVEVCAVAHTLPEPTGAAALPPLVMPSSVLIDDAADLFAPCPRCGGLEPWWDGLGRRRCAVCDGEILGRALSLAAHAARLRPTRPPGVAVVATAGDKATTEPSASGGPRAQP